jgi:hypothetical protein
MPKRLPECKTSVDHLKLNLTLILIDRFGKEHGTWTKDWSVGKEQSITPSVQYSNTPVLQVRLTSSFDKEGMSAVYQGRWVTPSVVKL